MPPRALLHADKSTRPLTDEQMGLLMASIAKSVLQDRNAKRDYVLIKGAYLANRRTQALRGENVENSLVRLWI